MEPNFKNVDIFLLQVYQLFKNSGKLKHLLHTIALNLNVTVMSFVKSHGTRFQNHKYQSTIKALIINLVPFYLLCENALAGGREVCRLVTTLPTLQGFFEKLQSCKYLAGMHFYRKAICITAHLSFMMQKQNALVIDVTDSIKEGLEKLEEIATDAEELPFPVIQNEEEDTLVIEARSANLPATQTFWEHNQLTETQKAKAIKFVTIHKKSITIKNVHQVSIFTFVVISFKTNTIRINLILGFKKFTSEFVCICACLCSVYDNNNSIDFLFFKTYLSALTKVFHLLTVIAAGQIKRHNWPDFIIFSGSAKSAANSKSLIAKHNRIHNPLL